MNSTELKENVEIKKWFSRINASENTRQSYLQAMQAYTEMTGKTPEQLILEAEAEVRVGKLMRERSIFTYLTDFRELLDSQKLALDGQKLAPLTIKNRMTGIRSFYKCNNIELPVLPKNMSKARPQKKRRDIPTKEQIQAILKFCDPLERALVLVGVSSGLAATEICNLKVGDFKKGRDDKTKITVLHVTRTKEEDYEFHTCLSPEATIAVDVYLAYRNRIVETEDKNKINQLEKQKVVSDDGYLFISRAVPNEYLTFQDTTKSRKENARIREEMRKLDTPGILGIYRRLSEKAQMSAPSGEWNLIRSHNLRRFFNTTLLNAGASIFLVDYAMGHVLDATHDGYYRNSPQKLREHYSEYVHLLTVNKETDEELMQKYEEEIKKSKALESDVVKMAIERTELRDLQEQLEIERADRTEYEKSVGLMIEDKIREAEDRMMQHMQQIATDPEYAAKYVKRIDYKDSRKERHVRIIKKPDKGFLWIEGNDPKP